MNNFFASLPIFLIVSYVIQCVFDCTWALGWGIYFTLRYFEEYGLDLSFIDKVKKGGLIIPKYNTKFLLLVCVAIGIPATYIILHLHFVP